MIMMMPKKWMFELGIGWPTGRAVAYRWKVGYPLHASAPRADYGTNISARMLRAKKIKGVPATVEILQVSAVLGLLERVFQVLLYLGYLLQIVRDLKPHHVCPQLSCTVECTNPIPTLTLHDTRKLVVLVEIDELLLRVLRRRAVRRITLTTERDVGEVQT